LAKTRLCTASFIAHTFDSILTRRRTPVRHSSPFRYHSLFGLDPAPPLPELSDDFTFVFDTKDQLPGSRDASLALHFDWIPSFIPAYRHIESVLAYSSTSRLDSVARYCWLRLDVLHQTLQQTIGRITADVRYLPVKDQLRPANTLNNLLINDAETFPVLWACHIAVERRVGVSSLLEESLRRIYLALGSISYNLALLAVRLQSLNL